MNGPRHLLRESKVRRLVLGVAIAAWALFTWSASGRLGSSDAEAMYAVAKSLVTHGGVDVGACAPHDNHCVPGADGRNYSGFGVLPSALAVPPFALARLVAPLDSVRQEALGKFAVAMTVGPISGALLVAAMTLLTLTLGYSRRTALAIAGTLALASPFWFYSAKGFYSEPLFALLLAGAVLSIVSSGRARHAAIAGALFGGAMFTRLVGVILLPAFAAFSRRASWRRVLAFALPIAVASLFIAWLNIARFGAATRTGYHLLFPTAAAMFRTPWLDGLTGLLLDGTAGLLWFFPAAVLAPFAWRSFTSRRADVAVFAAVAFAIQLLFHMKYAIWAGGWSVGPRMLLPVLPLLALPLAEWVERPSRVRRTALALTLGWACMMQLQWVLPPHFRMFTVREMHRDMGAAQTAQDRFALAFTMAATPRVVGYALGNRALTAEERSIETKGAAVNQLAPDVWWIKAIVVGQSAALMGLAALLLLATAFAGAVMAWRAANDQDARANAPPRAAP